MSDLVKRLDQALHFEDWMPVPENFSEAVPLLQESRNRIKELEAENAKLKQMWWDAGDVTELAGTIADLQAERDALREAVDEVTQYAKRHEAERDALEAKLAMAVQAAVAAKLTEADQAIQSVAANCTTEDGHVAIVAAVEKVRSLITPDAQAALDRAIATAIRERGE